MRIVAKLMKVVLAFSGLPKSGKYSKKFADSIQRKSSRKKLKKRNEKEFLESKDKNGTGQNSSGLPPRNKAKKKGKSSDRYM